MTGRHKRVRGAARRSGVVAGASLLAFVIPAAVGAPSADAKVTPSLYDLIASADTSSFEWDVEKAPLFAPQLAFVSPGSAGIELNSYGDSKGFAAAPFFGATLEGAGGLANGLGSGRIPPLPPTLPGYVTSSNPLSPSATASNGPYTLQAQSEQNSSSATAGVAGVSGQPTLLATTAHVLGSFDPPTGALTATAESITEPFDVGSLVTIGQVRTVAKMILDQDGKLLPSSAFDVGTITIAGIKMGLTGQGLQVADSSATPVTLDQLNQALAPYGISFKFLSGSRTPTSVVSDGLQITVAYQAPVEGATAEIITLGQATAHLEYKLTKNSLPTTVSGVLGGVLPPPAAPVVGNGDLPGVGVPSATVGAVPGAASPTTVTLRPEAAASAAGTLLSADAKQDLSHWYLVLLAVGLSLTLGARLVGALSIKS